MSHAIRQQAAAVQPPPPQDAPPAAAAGSYSISSGVSWPSSNRSRASIKSPPSLLQREYCGVPLQPGTQELRLESGFYVGTLDEEDRMTGFGKLIWSNGDVYVGEWFKDEMHGRGTYVWVDGDTYDGEYQYGKMEGCGKMSDHTGTYTGDWVDDKRHGHGTMVYKATDNSYEGDWRCDKRHGHGILIDVVHHTTYEGSFVNDRKHGYGTETNEEGDVYEGSFEDGLIHGNGSYRWANGRTFVGSFERGKRLSEDASSPHLVERSSHSRQLRKTAATARFGTLRQHEEEEDIPGLLSSAREGGSSSGGSMMPPRSAVRSAASIALSEDLENISSDMIEPISSELLRKILVNGNAAVYGYDEEDFEYVDEDEEEAEVEDDHDDDADDRGAAGRLLSASSRAGHHADPSASPGARSAAVSASGLHRQSSSFAIDGSAKRPSRRLSMEATPVKLATGPRALSTADLQGWQPILTVGKGSFGTVYKALLANKVTVVCCKVLNIAEVDRERDMHKVHNEVALMKQLSHPNIVQYYGSLEDKEQLVIVMEFVNGCSLNQVIHRFGPSVSLETMRQWVLQIVSGIQYLHSRGIVHRDIKGANVLLSTEGVVKLVDFGCSKYLGGDHAAASQNGSFQTSGCSTLVGTPYWMAPEVIKGDLEGGKSLYGLKSDIWSLGCTIVEMLTGKPPWPESTSMWAAVWKIANSTGLPTEIPPNLDPELMNFLECCFVRDPAKRASIEELRNHPFLRAISVPLTTSSRK